MDHKVMQGQLNSALKAINGIAPRKPTLPILGNVRIEATTPNPNITSGSMRLTVSNLAVSVTATIGGALVINPVIYTVPFETLRDLTALLVDRLDLDWQADTQQLVIESRDGRIRNKATIRGIHADEFPPALTAIPADAIVLFDSAAGAPAPSLPRSFKDLEIGILDTRGFTVHDRAGKYAVTIASDAFPEADRGFTFEGDTFVKYLKAAIKSKAPFTVHMAADMSAIMLAYDFIVASFALEPIGVNPDNFRKYAEAIDAAAGSDEGQAASVTITAGQNEIAAALKADKHTPVTIELRADHTLAIYHGALGDDNPPIMVVNEGVTVGKIGTVGTKDPNYWTLSQDGARTLIKSLKAIGKLTAKGKPGSITLALSADHPFIVNDYDSAAVPVTLRDMQIKPPALVTVTNSAAELLTRAFELSTFDRPRYRYNAAGNMLMLALSPDCGLRVHKVKDTGNNPYHRDPDSVVEVAYRVNGTIVNQYIGMGHWTPPEAIENQAAALWQALSNRRRDDRQWRAFESIVFDQDMSALDRLPDAEDVAAVRDLVHRARKERMDRYSKLNTEANYRYWCERAGQIPRSIPFIGDDLYYAVWPEKDKRTKKQKQQKPPANPEPDPAAVCVVGGDYPPSPFTFVECD